LNLDSLKEEILRYLDASGFAVFRGNPGALDDLPVITWDSESFPDYRMFLETANRSGAKVVVFISAVFGEDDLEDIEADVAVSGLDRDQTRTIEKRLNHFRAYKDRTCFLQIAFDHESRLYVYELQPDWYNDYLELTDELDIMLPHEHEHEHDEEEDEDDSLGGFYSNN
jgi:hypothetical protein